VAFTVWDFNPERTRVTTRDRKERAPKTIAWETLGGELTPWSATPNELVIGACVILGSYQRPMRIRPRSFLRLAEVACCTIAGAVGLIVLLGFPLVRAHDFNEHFRFNEARRFTIRHTSIETTKSEPAIDRILRTYMQPNPIIPVELKLNPGTQPDVTSVNSVPLPRLLMRLKLGVSRTRRADPLL
jgi:hypothetical protein